VRGLPKFDDPNLIVGTDNFSDAGVYRVTDDLYLVQTVDFFPPLIDDPFAFGQIAAANSLSDAFAMGAAPKTALNIVGFPDTELELSVLEQILAGGANKVQEAGAVIAGGHSVRDREIKYGLSVTAFVAPSQLMTNAQARPGDLLVLTKALGTGFLTTAGKKHLCSESALATAIASMSQLNAGAAEAARVVGARAATDVTGFGLAGHAGEMARASGVTLRLEEGRFPSLPEALDMLAAQCRTRASTSNRDFLEPVMRIHDGVDPTRVELAFDPQTSGGLLIAVSASQAETLVDEARSRGASATCIVGSVVEKTDVDVIIC
jgi:selenide,water dikinase